MQYSVMIYRGMQSRKKVNICVCIQNHLALQQKLTQYCQIKYTPIKMKRKCKAKTIDDNAVNVRNITMSMV